MTATIIQIPARPGSVSKDRTIGSDGGEGRIRCPKCRWMPGKHDRWMCNCLHIWNTFDTGGVCPACLKQWTVTQCLACHKISPHSDWYPKH
jgi:hypothetical protein